MFIRNFVFGSIKLNYWQTISLPLFYNKRNKCRTTWLFHYITNLQYTESTQRYCENPLATIDTHIDQKEIRQQSHVDENILLVCVSHFSTIISVNIMFFYRTFLIELSAHHWYCRRQVFFFLSKSIICVCPMFSGVF